MIIRRGITIFKVLKRWKPHNSPSTRPTMESRSLTLPTADFQAIRAATEAYVIAYMPNFKDSSHDWSHIRRVRKVALEIAEKESSKYSVNVQLVELASLLHDVGDKKFLAENESTEDCLRSCMNESNIPKHIQDALLWIIVRVSFRAEIESQQTGDSNSSDDNEELRRALHCVQDADRLDAIGAIGIARCLSFNGARNCPIYEENVQPIIIDGVYPKGSNARNHFFGKISIQ
jgi:uncharacterized protein